MHENHQREQYWFDEPTLARLADLVRQHERPALLCCPMLGQYLHERGHSATVLDVDTRFAHLPGFQRWDLYRPEALAISPDLIVFDPPFQAVRLDQMFTALRVLGGLEARLLMSWLRRREVDLLGALGAFGLRPAGFDPGYASCAPDATFYANF